MEILGATSAINTGKTGTLTLNQMMVSTLYVAGSWYKVDAAGTGISPTRCDARGGEREMCIRR